MFQKFYPDKIEQSTYQIAFDKLRQEGIKALIFDIDNTLVPHGAPADEACIALFKRLKELGFSMMLLSNNKEQRVKSFTKQIDVAYIFKAGKPSTKNYLLAMEQMKSNVENTIFIGDQLFTDIYGAKKAGIPTILVKPIHPKEEIQIVLKRRLEKVVLYFYQKQLKKDKR